MVEMDKKTCEKSIKFFFDLFCFKKIYVKLLFNLPKLTSFLIKVCYKLSGWVTKERLTNIMAIDGYLSDYISPASASATTPFQNINLEYLISAVWNKHTR